jgi:TetR/AcrR family transcriptional regulator of autoinduction and epiphytic fitness
VAGANPSPAPIAEPDPRVERSRRVILEAVLDELGEVGYGSLTIEAVAARAGVGKSTIYRHWSGKLALVEDAFRTLKATVVVPEAGTLRERVVGMLEQVARLVQESTYTACMPALIDAAERDPQVRDFHCRFSAERRAVLVDLLRDAVEAGELPATVDPEFLADALVGSIFLRRLLLHEPLDPALVPALVDQLLPEPPRRAGRAVPGR